MLPSGVTSVTHQSHIFEVVAEMILPSMMVSQQKFTRKNEQWISVVFFLTTAIYYKYHVLLCSRTNRRIQTLDAPMSISTTNFRPKGCRWFLVWQQVWGNEGSMYVVMRSSCSYMYMYFLIYRTSLIRTLSLKYGYCYRSGHTIEMRTPLNKDPN